MGMVITKTGTTVHVDYDGLHKEFEKTNIDIAHIRSTNKCKDDKGVVVIFSALNSTTLHYQFVDQVGANTDITSNEKLFNALEVLKNA